jgi:transcriptional regulator GlxA family with amidase domain
MWEMARQLGLSKRYLTSCFHKEMGITPVEYLNRHRLKEAKVNLPPGTHSIQVTDGTGKSSTTWAWWSSRQSRHPRQSAVLQ